METEKVEEEETFELDFLSRNIRLFLGKNFDENMYKDAKKGYQNQKQSFIDDKKIAQFVIELLIQSNFFKTKAELERTLKNNFFRKNIINTKIQGILDEFLPPVAPFSFTIFNDLLGREIIKKKLEKEKIEISRTKLDELSNKIEEKELEYAATPSILDAVEVEEPEIFSEAEEYIPWWKDLDLIADPFVSTEGLSKIPDDLIDQILVRTAIFEKYQKCLKADADFIFYKSTVFFGQYGSGKTTLFEFIQRELVNYHIKPVYIILRPEKDKYGTRVTFENKVKEKLNEEFSNITGACFAFAQNQDTTSQVKSLMIELTKHNIQGFAIFIDDLHKGNGGDNEIAMSFLRDLQGFKDELVRAGIKIGFIIAGSLSWENQINQDISLTGSIERKEKMPIITTELAAEAINKRLFAYSKMKTAGIIKVSFLNQVYRDLENNRFPITYRSFFQATIEQFLQKNFTVLEIKVPPKTREAIKKILEQNQILKKRFNKYLYGLKIQKEETRRNGLKLLITLFLDKFYADKSSIINENIFNFKKLAECDLIVKAKRNSEIGWTVCEELKKVNELIYKEYNLSLEDYLLPIYGELPFKMEEKRANSNSYIDSIVATIPFDKTFVKSSVLDSKQGYIHVKSCLENTGEKINSQIIDECKQSFDFLSKAFFVNQGILDENAIRQSNTFSLWQNYPFTPENILEYLRIIASPRLNEIEIREAGHWYLDSYENLISLIKKQNDTRALCNLDFSGLSFEESREFEYLVDSWIKKDYYSAVSKTSFLFQRKLRNFLNNVFLLQYSPDRSKWSERIEKSVWSYIQSNLAKCPFQTGSNIFEQLNRGNYKNIITGNFPCADKNWGEIFSFVLAPTSRKDFDAYLSQLAEYLIIGEHDKSSTKIASSDAYHFLSETKDYFVKINRAYKRLLKNNLFCDGGGFYFSIAGLKMDKNGKDSNEIQDKKSISPIRTQEIIGEMQRLNDSIKHQLQQGNDILIDIENEEKIEKEYVINYPTFVFFFAYWLQHHKYNLRPEDRPREDIVILQEVGSKIWIKTK